MLEVKMVPMVILCFVLLLQREADGLKIKTKMLEDQTETIRKLKEVNNNIWMEVRVPLRLKMP